MKEYFVYIVRCRDKSYYTGVCNDVQRRLIEHQDGCDPKSYTFKRRPVELVYQYKFQNVLDAIAVEKQIKGWSRKKKEALINGNEELLPRLSENPIKRTIRLLSVNIIQHCINVGVMVSTDEPWHRFFCKHSHVSSFVCAQDDTHAQDDTYAQDDTVMQHTSRSKSLA